MKAIFLDLDGTLINSEYAFSRCFIDYLKMLIKHTKECGIIKNNINENTIMKEVYKSYEPYFREIINEAKSKENFKLIRKIKNNYKLGLITTCRRKYLDILNNQEKIYELFDIVIAIEESKRGIDASISANKVLKRIIEKKSI